MRKLLMLMLAVGLLVGCGEEKAVKEPSKAEEKTIRIEEKEPVKIEESDTLSPDEALYIIQESLQKSSKITLNEETKTYQVYITDEKLKLYIMRMMAGEVSLDKWNEMVDIYKKISQTISDMVGRDYAVQLHNPANDDMVILLLMDGTVLYDSLNNYKMFND